MSKLYHFIHSTGPVADLAYKTWHKIYDAKETLRPLSSRQTPVNGVYPMVNLSVSISEICTAKCVFCIHPRLEGPKVMMPNALFADIMEQWTIFNPPKDRLINITPGSPPGEPLSDSGFLGKLDMIKNAGFKCIFVTNGTLLHKFSKAIVASGAVGQIGISIPSFDPDVYRKIYRVDKCEQVKKNLWELLQLNEEAGCPIDITVCFRNAESPSQIIAHPEFNRLKTFFNDKVRCMFTTWWDDWNGGVPHEEMEQGWIKVRKPLNLHRVCEGALGFSMRPTDRKIRLCGCRIVPGADDMIVGNLDKGFADAQKNAFFIHEGFRNGCRTKTCTNCGAYKQA